MSVALPHRRPVEAIALGLAVALPGAVAAQDLACDFTIVCAPEIDCDTLPGLPITLRAQDGDYALTVEGTALRATPRLAGGLLSMSFERADEVLMFSLAPNGDAALTRHEITATGRLGATSFLGTCVGS